MNTNTDSYAYPAQANTRVGAANVSSSIVMDNMDNIDVSGAGTKEGINSGHGLSQGHSQGQNQGQNQGHSQGQPSEQFPNRTTDSNSGTGTSMDVNVNQTGVTGMMGYYSGTAGTDVSDKSGAPEVREYVNM